MKAREWIQCLKAHRDELREAARTYGVVQMGVFVDANEPEDEDGVYLVLTLPSRSDLKRNLALVRSLQAIVGLSIPVILRREESASAEGELIRPALRLLRASLGAEKPTATSTPPSSCRSNEDRRE